VMEYALDAEAAKKVLIIIFLTRPWSAKNVIMLNSQIQ